MQTWQVTVLLFRNKRSPQSSSMPGSSCRQPQMSLTQRVLPRTMLQPVRIGKTGQIGRGVQRSPLLMVRLTRPDMHCAA